MKRIPGLDYQALEVACADARFDTPEGKIERPVKVRVHTDLEASRRVYDFERVDRHVQIIARSRGLSHAAIDAQVALVDRRLAANRTRAVKA